MVFPLKFAPWEPRSPLPSPGPEFGAQQKENVPGSRRDSPEDFQSPITPPERQIGEDEPQGVGLGLGSTWPTGGAMSISCLLYTSDAADDYFWV